MNTSKNRWGIHATSSSHSEIIQRLAFGFGYKWIHMQKQTEQIPVCLQCRRKNSFYLIFNPDDKTIEGVENFSAEYSVDLVETLDQALELFKNPPVRILKIGDLMEVSIDGSVKIVTYPVTFSGEEFDKMVIDREVFLNREIKDHIQIIKNRVEQDKQFV